MPQYWICDVKRQKAKRTTIVHQLSSRVFLIYCSFIIIHLSLLIMSRKYLLLCPAYWTQWEQHGELRSPCNSGVRAFGPIKQLGDSDSSYIALQYRHSKCYPLRLHSITIDLYTVTGQDRDGQLNFDHLYSMYMYVFVSDIYI